MTMNLTDLKVGGLYKHINSGSLVEVVDLHGDRVWHSSATDPSSSIFGSYATSKHDFCANYELVDEVTKGLIATSESSPVKQKAVFKKDELDNPVGKPIPGALDVEFLNEMSKVLAFGAKKYGRDNWKAANIKQRVAYVDAAFRHIFAALLGEQKDGESGCYHWAHAAVNIMFLFYWRKKNDKK